MHELHLMAQVVKAVEAASSKRLPVHFLRLAKQAVKSSGGDHRKATRGITVWQMGQGFSRPS